MLTSRRLLVLPAAAALVLAGCGAGSDAAGNGGGSGGEGADLSVVAGFYPLQYVTEAVGGDRVRVTNLTRPGVEAHDLELAPRDVGTVAEADLVVYLADFQPAVDDAVATEAQASFDVTAAADLMEVATEDATDHDHGHGHDDHEQTDEEHSTDDGHDHGPSDPHFWLDPTRLAAVGDAVAEQLTELDPDGAQTYADGAAALREQLTGLDAELQAGLTDCAVEDLVTAHTAFGYLAERYGFHQVGITGISPDSEPDPRTVARVAELVREHGVTTVYSEVLVDPAVAETVAAEAGVQTALLDPLEGITDASPGTDYPSVMRANLETLRQGQSCS